MGGARGEGTGVRLTSLNIKSKQLSGAIPARQGVRMQGRRDHTWSAQDHPWNRPQRPQPQPPSVASTRGAWLSWTSSFFGYKSSTGRSGGAGKTAVLSRGICGISHINTDKGPKYPGGQGTPNFLTLGLGHALEKRCWFLLRPIFGEEPPLEVKPRLSDMNYGF